jgi:2-dehydro-3-deoxyphosphogluconate aldolase/(4S)-4-hydroxy-2-oxoglutarate aldolase
MTLVREISETQVVRQLASARIVAGGVFDRAPQAAETGAALMRGGIRCLEVGVHANASATKAIRAARAVDGLLVGAGGIVDAEQAERAAHAGAQFATAPGTNMTVVHACRELELPFFPGVATPSEVERLCTLEVTAMGVFPAGALGGPPFLEALAAAYPRVAFLPQGGVRRETLRSYVALSGVLAVRCDWIVRDEHVRTGTFVRTEWLAREARATAGFRSA